MAEFVAHCTVDNNDTIVIGTDDDGGLVFESTEGVSGNGSVICISGDMANYLADFLIDAGFGRNAV